MFIYSDIFEAFKHVEEAHGHFRQNRKIRVFASNTSFPVKSNSNSYEDTCNDI